MPGDAHQQPDVISEPVQPAEIVAVYSGAVPNEPISLGSHRVKIDTCGSCHEGDVEICLRLLPTPTVVVEGSLADFPNVSTLGPAAVVLSERGSLPTNAMSIGPERFVLHAKYRGAALTSGNAKCQRVIFHLLNFPAFFSKRVAVGARDRGQQRLDQVILTTENWRITLSTLSEARDLLKSLRETGGFAITHVGGIERIDGQSFDGDDAEKLLTMIHHYLSFVRGAWAAPVLLVGYDEHGAHVYEHWGVRACSPWAYHSSWFDSHHGQLIEDVFGGFARKWRDEVWQQPIQESVYWYLVSNTGGHTDAGIVLTQTGLELLSWTYSVTANSLISVHGFDRLPAADRMRLLFSSLGLPLEIPPKLVKLTAVAGELNWVDAPQALTAVRNAIVHPQARQREFLKECTYDAWELGLWYLELTLLRLFGHDGNYSNRMHHGKYAGGVIKVPWAEEEGKS